MSYIKSVAIFGSSKAEPNSTLYTDAYSTAKLLGEKKYKIINGGGPGVMLAATLGAKEAKAKTTAISYDPELATFFEGGAAANQADWVIKEKNYILRTKKLLELGDVYVIFNGGTGTLSEFAMAWGVAKLYFGHHKPLILFGDFWRDIIETIKNNMIPAEEEYKVFSIATTPQEVVDAIEKFEIVLKLNHNIHQNCNGEECGLML